MNSLTLQSPAKLNLLLRVAGKRPDGFHELVTLFHRISLHDTLKIRETSGKGIRISCSHPGVPLRSNIMVRAFHLLKGVRSFKGGIVVRLTKRIPVAAGMGGGSSNAASFLLGMNRLFNLRLTPAESKELGSRLGADVAFFMTESVQSLGTGKGEVLTALPFKKKLWFIVLPGRKGLSTAQVYSRLKRSGRLSSSKRFLEETLKAHRLLSKKKISQAEPYLVNDLTVSADEIRPRLYEEREKLSRLGLGTCRMTGSGPALFFIFSSRKKALEAHQKIRTLFPQREIILCRTR